MDIAPLYYILSKQSEALLDRVLLVRARRGKELHERLAEKKGLPSKPRPPGPLIWVHAASIGEAQSALIVIKKLLERYDSLHILVTSGTVTSARILENNLPPRAFHQFYPLDHPAWIVRFLDHWCPEYILWMESELWPNMLAGIKKQKIPCILINARLSPRSFMRWRVFKKTARNLLSSFTKILCQTEKDAQYYSRLGAENIVVTDNIKYSATPLGFEENDLKTLIATLQNRPRWVYASSHKGEEILAAQTHEILKSSIPDLLTIIVPRHPERANSIAKDLENFKLKIDLRGAEKKLPSAETDLYICNTLGELGLFYRLCPIALIGRSFSDDGGGGHNPIEAAQLGCAVMHGSNVQNLQDIFDQMNREQAAILLHNKEDIALNLKTLFDDPEMLQRYQNNALSFAKSKDDIIDTVMQHILMSFDALSTSEKKS